MSSLNKKITTTKSKNLLVGNELKKLKTFGLGYFRGKSHFEEDGIQNYLVFKPMHRCFKGIAGVGRGDYIYYWQSKGLSDEKINSIKTSDYFITPYLRYYVTKTRVEFNGNYLKQDKITYTHRKIVNIYIVYEIVGSSGRNNHPTLQNAQFGAVKLTKNANIDKYRYSSYGIGFDWKSSFSHPSGGDGQNVIIFGIDMSSWTKIDNRKKDILILGKAPTQGLEHILTAEKIYLINFSRWYTKLCLSLHYNGSNSSLFVNGTEIY